MEEQLGSPHVKEIYNVVDKNGDFHVDEYSYLVGDVDGELYEYESLFAYMHYTLKKGNYFILCRKDEEGWPHSKEILVYLGRRRPIKKHITVARIVYKFDDLKENKDECRVFEHIRDYIAIEHDEDCPPNSLCYICDLTSKIAKTPEVVLEMIKSLELPEEAKQKDYKFLTFMFSLY